MGAINLIFGQKTKPRVGVIQFDCAVDELHTYGAVVSEHPVESGSNITDHIRRDKKRFQLVGMISNTPIINLEKEDSISPDVNDRTSPDNRVGLAFRLIDEIIDSGSLVDVVTSLTEYKNMVILSRSIPRSAESGNVLTVTLDMQQVILTQTKEVAAPTPVDVSKKQTIDQGKKAKTEANLKQEEKTKSILRSIKDSLFSG